MNTPRPRPVQCCLTCRCWQMLDNSAIGSCCRHSPICPPQHNGPDGFGRFPKTQAVTFCGEWSWASPELIAERKTILSGKKDTRVDLNVELISPAQPQSPAGEVLSSLSSAPQRPSTPVVVQASPLPGTSTTTNSDAIEKLLSTGGF